MSEEQSPQLPAETPVPATETAPPPVRRASAQPLALAALAVAIGTAVGGYFIWHEVQRLDTWQQQVLAQIDSRTQALDQRLATFKDRLDNDLAAVERGRRDIDDEQRKLAAAQASFEDALAVLRAQIGRSQDEWILAEVQYLLHIANQRAQLERDTQTAVAALRNADQRLQTLADPGFNAVREEIARELAALEAVAQPDLAGIALTLDTLAAQVVQWPLKDRQTPHDLSDSAPGDSTPGDSNRGEPTSESTPAPASDWRGQLENVLANVWDALRSLVVVRRNDAPVAPLLAPEQEFFLHENLRLQLSIARLAALQGETTSYRASLKTAATWLRNHFADDAPTVIAAQAELQRLAGLDVHPDLPDISAALRLLRQQMHNAAGETPRGTGP
ncbi:MAG: uroporphyrinogen-III C-methyltransferase [Gammaproteobacteria bacterium]|nr:uroporphyrinogen-III C-methyltransferase [Gammaproteobacteria bacterium]